MIVLTHVNAPALSGRIFSTAIGRMRYPRIDCLAPTWDIVQGVKSGRITPEEYTARYRELMTARWPAVKQWLNGLQGDETLLCFCRPGTFCHRQLIAKMIARHRPDLALEIR